MKVSAEIETFRPNTLVAYATMCGWALARAHAKAGDAAMISGYLGSTDQSMAPWRDIRRPTLIRRSVTSKPFRRPFALSSSMLAYPSLLRSSFGQTHDGSTPRPIRLAVLGSSYRLGSDLQTIADRFLVGYPSEGEWHLPRVQVVSMYVDEPVRKAAAGPTEFQLAIAGRSRRSQVEEPASNDDLSAARAKQFGFRICRNIPEALRCGGDKIAVDAVLVVVEQCKEYPYPSNDKGQVLLPRYDFFQQCVQVFENEKRSVLYFNHKQLSFSFAEAEAMVKSADRLQFPLMAGSSMPVTWRLPDIDVPAGACVQEAVMVGVGSFGGMDFDAMDAMQSMLERRKGGETGVKAVQFLEGDDVWAAGQAGRWSKDLLSSALSRSDTTMGLTVLDGRNQDLVADGVLPQLVKDPAAYCFEYVDGTRATLLMLNGAIRDFNIACEWIGRWFRPSSSCLCLRTKPILRVSRRRSNPCTRPERPLIPCSALC